MATNAPAARAGRISLPDLTMALAAVVVIGLMVIPLPSILLDVLLAVNITAALTVLLVSMYVGEALEFSVSDVEKVGEDVAVTLYPTREEDRVHRAG